MKSQGSVIVMRVRLVYNGLPYMAACPFPATLKNRIHFYINIINIRISNDVDLNLYNYIMGRPHQPLIHFLCLVLSKLY